MFYPASLACFKGSWNTCLHVLGARGGRGGRTGGRAPKSVPTAEELDAELDAYVNKVQK